MYPNEKLLHTFYTCFQRKDHKGMAACYAPDAVFSDPIFNLKGKKIAAMWHMLFNAGKDLEIDFTVLEADENKGRVHWEASYTLLRTQRKVQNIVEAEFHFANGKIIRHHDEFGFYRWVRMALGPTGLALGWLPIMRKKLQGQMQEALREFIEKHSS